MISGLLLFHVVAIPLVFLLGRMSTRVAFLRVRAEKPTKVSEFLNGRGQ
ncbi:MAG TPA: hypothetical protein VFV52_10510 [Bacilli bacterium]|nr:hypothetical protein [Bacilli bacterium]